MFHKTVTLPIFALLLAVASCRPQADLNECSGKENGLHPDQFDNNAFYVCFNDELIVHSKCEPGELFDVESKTCTGGSEDQDLTAYSGGIEADDSVDQVESQVSNLLDESLESDQETLFPYRPTSRPPSTPKPTSTPSPPPPPPPPHFPHPPPGHRPPPHFPFPPPPHFPFPPLPPPGHRPPPPFNYTNKIVNVQMTENIFPRSVLVIGRANREQKNK